MTKAAKPVESYQGFGIFYDKEEAGYYWDNGGYFNSIRATRDDIHEWNKCERENDPGYPPTDTPALDPPWWEYR